MTDVENVPIELGDMNSMRHAFKGDEIRIKVRGEGSKYL